MSIALTITRDLSVNQRIKFLIDQYSMLTQRAFAERIGVSQSAISSLFSQRENRPGLDMLQKIAIAYPEVSLDWLMLGQGQMLRGAIPMAASTASTSELAQFIRDYMQISKQLEGIKATVRELRRNQALLKEDVDYSRQSLDVIKENQSNFNQDAQIAVKGLIGQCQQMLAKAQERYNNFLPMLDQAETELINMLNYQGKLEGQINSIVQPD